MNGNLTKCTVKFPQNRDLTADVLIDGYDKDKKCLELRQIESVKSADELSTLITKFNITGVPEIFYWGKQPVLMERRQNDDSYETKFVYLNGAKEWESKTYNTFSSEAQMILSSALYYVKDGATFYRNSTIGTLSKVNDSFLSGDAKLPWKYCACINGVHIAINNKDLFMGTDITKIAKHSHPE